MKKLHDFIIDILCEACVDRKDALCNKYDEDNDDDDEIKICEKCIEYQIKKHDSKVKKVVVDNIRDTMTFHQEGLSGYFTISLEEWNKLEEKYDND